MFKHGDQPGLGSVGIKDIPDEHKGDLRKWLKDVLCTNCTPAEINDYVEGRGGAWAKKRIGRWHFDMAMLKTVRGGGLGLDWQSGTRPYPIKSLRDVIHTVSEDTPTPTDRVEKRAHSSLEAAMGEDSSPMEVQIVWTDCLVQGRHA